VTGDGNEKERKREGTTGSKEEKRDQGTGRRIWERIKNGVYVPYCESTLLETI